MVRRPVRLVGISGESQEVSEIAGLAGLVLALVGAILGLDHNPELEYLWGIVLITALTVMGRTGARYVAACAIAAGLGLVWTLGHNALPILLTYVLPGLVMGLSILKFPGFAMVLTLGLTSQLAGLAAWWLYQKYTGIPLAVHPLETAAVQYFKMIESSPDLNAVYDEAARESLELLKNWTLQFLAEIRWGLYIGQAWFKVLIALVCSKLLMRKETELLKTKPFQQQQMAWQLDWLVILGLVLWLVGAQWNIQGARVAGSNILFLMMPLTFYFGLAVTVYFLRRWKDNNLLIGAFVFFCLLAPPYAVIFIAVVGLFDPLLDYRDLEREGEHNT